MGRKEIAVGNTPPARVPRAYSLELLEISSELVPIEQAFEAQGGEVTPQTEHLVARVTALLDRHKDLVELLGNYVLALEGGAEFHAKQAKRVAERGRHMANKAEAIRAAAKLSMDMRHLLVVQGHTLRFCVEKNGGQAPVIVHDEYERNPERLPPQFRRVTPAPDKDALRKALEAGDKEAAKYATLGDVGTSLRLR